jgi:hypothetical protein
VTSHGEPRDPPPAFDLFVVDAAAVDMSAVAVLPLVCDVKLSEGHEVCLTRRSRVSFLPERLAIAWPVADQVDVLDVKVEHRSLFSDLTPPPGATLPGESFAARWTLRRSGVTCEPAGPSDSFHAFVVPSGGSATRIGREIPGRPCRSGEDVQIILRARGLVSRLEVLVLGRIPP